MSFHAKRSPCENPGIPGEKSLNLKQISPRVLVEMTVKKTLQRNIPVFFWRV